MGFIRQAASIAVAAAAFHASAWADYKAGMDALAVRDFARARAEFESDTQNHLAIYQLARMALDGYGEPRNEARAAGLLERAAELGHAGAAIELAYLLGNGRGVTKDSARAVALLEGLVARGNTEAQLTLGMVLHSAWWGTPPDVPRGMSLLKQAMDAGNLEAKSTYARFLIYGEGAKDVSEGMKLMREAADDGDSAAMVGLGLAYQQGTAGVAKDPAAAYEWMRKAADKGNRGGQYGVAMAYSNGWGVPRDAAAAARWADAAARQGDTWAQLFLADAYQGGTGVPRMRNEAYFWLTIASRGTGRAAERANERRVVMGRDMKQEDIDAAVRRADAFKTQPGFRPRAAALPSPSRSGSVTIGAATIDVPAPRGYVNNWELVDWLQRAHPNDADLRPLLVVYSRQEDVDRTKLGIAGAYRSMEVAEYGPDPTTAVTPALFADIRRQVRDTMDKSVAAGKYRLEQPPRDDDRAFTIVRSGVAQGDKLDAQAFVLVKQRVLWISFTGFRPEHAAELKELVNSAIDGVVSSNRGFFGS